MFYLWMTLIAALSSWTLKADQCAICLAYFHNRNEVPMVVKTGCCGQPFDLDCISKCFVDQPIGSRRCAMCRQNPMPLVNQNTSEAHPDTFFPDRTFYSACSDGDLDQVERSLAEGVNVNAVMTDDFTALMLASLGGHIEVVERLIKAGADVNATRTKDGDTPLYMAAQENNTNCLKALIEAKADLNARTEDGVTPLFIAVWRGNTDCVEILINAGADLNAARTSDGATPLFTAAWRGYTDCLEILIHVGADLNAVRTSDGATPLVAAFVRGNTECEKALIEAEAYLNALD
ncbi:ankyrin repeat domain-containing protein [Endozoicomonas sp. 8E]|uniref:ankyrin repeat domain-containing protein n=1 Tax=Endozoicomonas sp. 8E TaxID=3035692 RepID=UPI0029393694|nr:ankyrin repeat domain-containing protein [Endozoicomonas sp. 8E]WOG28644.1 ankyrin repeat domain-containing protein [Endozoicomonas sp. 8E]